MVGRSYSLYVATPAEWFSVGSDAPAEFGNPEENREEISPRRIPIRNSNLSIILRIAAGTLLFRWRVPFQSSIAADKRKQRTGVIHCAASDPNKESKLLLCQVPTIVERHGQPPDPTRYRNLRWLASNRRFYPAIH